MTNNDTIKALREAVPHVDKFMIKSMGGDNITVEGNQWFCHAHEVEAYNKAITALITQLEQAEGVDLEKGARAIWDAVPHHCEVTWDEAKKLEFMQQEYKATMRQARACYEANNIKVKE